MTSSGGPLRTSSASKTNGWPAALSEVAPTDRVLWTLQIDRPKLDATVLDVAQLSHSQRLHELLARQVRVLVCTPTDALRLSEHAAVEHTDLAQSAVRLVVVSGEPGGSVPSTRRRIE